MARPQRRGSGDFGRTLIVAAGVVVGVLLGACGDDVDEGQRIEPDVEDESTVVTEDTTTTTTQPPRREFAIGDKVQLEDGSTVVLHSFARNVPSPNQYVRPDPGMVYAVAEVEGCAGPQSGGSVTNSFYFPLVMADNTRYSASFLPVKEPTLQSANLAPGDCNRGFISYEIPATATPGALHYERFDTSVKWRLN